MPLAIRPKFTADVEGAEVEPADINGVAMKLVLPVRVARP
jgi:hypothetical protein